jgi:hypothetical protein
MTRKGVIAAPKSRLRLKFLRMTRCLCASELPTGTEKNMSFFAGDGLITLTSLFLPG